MDALSLVTLLGGIGLVLALYGRYSRSIGWHETEERRLRFVPPADVPLTPAQRVTAWFFLVVAALFLLQNLVGGATVHYMVEAGGFFGIDLPKLLPYNLSRTWHLQMAIFFVAAAYLAAGIFLAPLIAGREPRGQGLLATLLLVALTVVVFGSLGGEFLSYHGRLPRRDRVFFGAQGWEYLDLGRFWMILLICGMLLWLVIIYRGLRPRLAVESRGNLPWLFLYSSLSIPAFYAIGLLTRTQSTFAIGDFWRFWVVHLWVEDFLELFTTMLVALIFVLLGIVSERFATRLIYFDILLYSVGGVVGTLHHCYFSGGPAVEMALGAFFSAGEVIPLTLLTVEAWSFLQLGNRQQVGERGGVPAPLGGPVPGVGRVLELPRRGGVWLPDQPAGCQLLPDRHAPDLQPRPRGLHGRVRHAGAGTAGLLHAVSGPAGGLERGAGALFVLGDEPRPDDDDPGSPVPAGCAPAR